jgi:hypothetical protein
MRHNLTNLHDHHDPFPTSSLSHRGTGLYRLLPVYPSGFVSFLSCLLALIARHQHPTPLLYPVHRIPTSVFSRISLGFPCPSTHSLYFLDPLSLRHHHAPETHSTNPIRNPYITIFYLLRNTVVVAVIIETYPTPLTLTLRPLDADRVLLLTGPIQSTRCSVLTKNFPFMRVRPYAPAFFPFLFRITPQPQPP